jgi:hypothetical protein
MNLKNGDKPYDQIRAVFRRNSLDIFNLSYTRKKIGEISKKKYGTNFDHCTGVMISYQSRINGRFTSVA